ncbi:MAG TPA: cobyric acid synthase, partial [Egibacteraceae bacterium]|nr:cobyric acid synthase [Egibacteraceae bacterium]
PGVGGEGAAVRGALLVAGTSSDAGKSVVVAGICRWLARRGVKVAPFKAQNMALNSAVTADGGEIGRAQAMQAAAAGAEPEAAMNPVLLKPATDGTSHVVVLGHPAGRADARSYLRRRSGLLSVACEALSSLRSRYDVVVCEGAGSPAEVNLRAHDLANLGLARAAGLPVVVVGDIDRGGVFAALYGTLALLEPADQALVCGWLINRFRGDPGVLAPGLERLRALTGRPVLGVLPHIDGLWLDVEDSLALDADRGLAPAPLGPDGLHVAVVRLRRMSNFTDVDALACEPGVTVAFTASPAEVARADLAVVPGTRCTVDDLAFVRSRGLDAALADRACRAAPVLGICGGYQLLGRSIVDDLESGAGRVEGLGLLPVDTVFAADKVLARPTGTSPAFGGVPVAGYEVRHGRTRVGGGAPLLRRADGAPEGCVDGAVLGTCWHGLLEADDFRRALLGWVAERRGLRYTPGRRSFAAAREQRLDALGDLVEHHADLEALAGLIERGAPPGLPVIPPAGAAPTATGGQAR